MKKIVLLNPPLTKEERGGYLSAAIAQSIPYGLISIASVVRTIGYEVFLIDAMNFNYSLNETVREILGINPKYVGISLVTLSVEKAAAVAEQLKKNNKNINVIVGGAHISSIPEETMKVFTYFDIGVIGEGEETMVELLTSLEGRKCLRDVKGIIYREKGDIIKTEKRDFIKNLNSLPFPAWDILKNMVNFYRPSAPSYLRLPSTTIVTSRGCPGNCIFCNSKAIFGGLRCFSADYVIGMIEYLVNQYAIKDLSIYDDNFLFFQERVREICRKIIDRRLNITWSCYSRVDQGNLELFKLMKRAGCWQISYGIESGAQRILDFIKKNVTLKQIENTIRDTKKAGIRARGFFMIGHITEDKNSICETLSFMKNIPLDDFHFTYFTPLPGTAAYSIAENYGKFDRTWHKMNMQNAVFIPRGLKAEEMEYYSKLAYRTFYFRVKIIVAYLYMFCKYPNNIKRIANGLSALISRVFSRRVVF